MGAVAFLLSWFIEERPLRQTVETNLGESLGAPVDTDSMSQLTRALSRPDSSRANLFTSSKVLARTAPMAYTSARNSLNQSKRSSLGSPTSATLSVSLIRLALLSA